MGVFINIIGDPVRGTLQWPSHPLPSFRGFISLSAPFCGLIVPHVLTNLTSRHCFQTKQSICTTSNRRRLFRLYRPRPRFAECEVALCVTGCVASGLGHQPQRVPLSTATAARDARAEQPTQPERKVRRQRSTDDEVVEPYDYKVVPKMEIDSYHTRQPAARAHHAHRSPAVHSRA